MWRFKQFMPKEPTGLEGRTVDIGNHKVNIRNAIAEGGFSCVYLARDAVHVSRQYALKHIICNDEESLELAMKEISVMRSLKGHPNVVILYAHTILDMGRTKEALLLLEYCEKSLVSVLESRGAGFFDETQVLTIFRDVCNAVFAMHCQAPPIAHRDLKAENLLLGHDGLWKLCDFGSTSTNHKRFEKPEEMGIEEDNIRKYTTPAYRPPEMWDLYRRELISEKVDIWALGCLLFRICYFKSAFDGESKLQILNGNYRIPDLPKYSTSVTDLIKDMLQSSPDARPDITQVWFRVNDLLPEDLQKSLPDRSPELPHQVSETHGGTSKPANKSSPVPRRSPPPPPSADTTGNSLPASNNPKMGGSASGFGAFWTTQHAKDSAISEDKTRSEFDEELPGHEKINPTSNTQKSTQGRSVSKQGDFGINLFPDASNQNTEKSKPHKPDGTPRLQSDAFNAFVAEFGTNKSSPGSNSQKSGKEEFLEAEVERLKENLAQMTAEKAEITSKYEKLTAICRSQRQEIQELKQALAARTPSLSKKEASPSGQPSATLLREKIEGTVWELQQGLLERGSPGQDPQPWQAFADETKTQATSANKSPMSVRTRNGRQNKHNTEVNTGANTWGFGTDNFKAVPASSSQINVPGGDMNKGRPFNETGNKQAAQPAGWAGF